MGIVLSIDVKKPVMWLGLQDINQVRSEKRREVYLPQTGNENIKCDMIRTLISRIAQGFGPRRGTGRKVKSDVLASNYWILEVKG